MQISVTYMKPTAVLYTRAIGPYERSVSTAWNHMLGWLDTQRVRRRTPRGFGIINDDPRSSSADDRRYDACVELQPGLTTDPSAGIGRAMTPGGAFAVARIRGPHSAIRDAFKHLRNAWVPAHGLKIDPDRPHLEIYLNDPAITDPTDLLTEVCVPVLP